MLANYRPWFQWGKMWLDVSNIKLHVLCGHESVIIILPVYIETIKWQNRCILIHLQFVSHPLAYRLLNQRWNYGLPSKCLPGKKLGLMLYIFTILDTILTPVLLPFITYVFYKDQTVSLPPSGRREDRSLRGLHSFIFIFKSPNASGRAKQAQWWIIAVISFSFSEKKSALLLSQHRDAIQNRLIR